jgi:hypothetical protein
MSTSDTVFPRRREMDPPERWELSYTEKEGGSYFRANRGSYPFTPRRAEDIPRGALESLREICRVEGLHQVFIIPRAVRGLGAQKLISPNSVLAIGARAVGLWTEKPEPGVKVSILLDEVAAIEDITILLYGRLSFLPFGDRLTIRYNTVARPELEPSLLELRKRLAGPAQRVPQENESMGELPCKWRNVVRSTSVRLQEGAPVAFRFAESPKRSRHSVEHGELLVLNPYELVSMSDPVNSDSVDNLGADSLIVPLSRISDVQIQENDLAITVNGVHFRLTMLPKLCEAAARWLRNRESEGAAGKIGPFVPKRREYLL